MAETIHSRQAPQYRGGLIYLAYDLGRKDLAASFAKTAIRLSKSARRQLLQPDRCRRAIRKTRTIRRLLGI